MKNKEIKSYLEQHLEILKRAVKDKNRSGEELKAITEAIISIFKLL